MRTESKTTVYVTIERGILYIPKNKPIRPSSEIILGLKKLTLNDFLKRILTGMFILLSISFANAQNTYSGYETQVENGLYQQFRFQREFKKEGDNFVTRYFLYDGRGKNYLNVSVTNNISNQKIKVNLVSPSGGVFGTNDTYNISYNSCTGYLIGEAGILSVFGSNLLECVLFFKDSKRDFLLVNQVMDKEYVEGRIHYEFEQIPKNILKLDKKLKQSCEQLEANRIKKEQIEYEKQRLIVEKQRLVEEDNAKKIEEERIRQYLVERKNKIYDYSEIEPSKYTQLKAEIESRVLSGVKKSNIDSINITTEIMFKIDTNSIKTISVQNISNNKSLQENIEIELDKIQTQTAYKEGYSVNSKSSVKIELSKTIKTYTVKYVNKEFTLMDGDYLNFETNKSFIVSEFVAQNYPDGNFVVEYSQIALNQRKEESMKVREYKGFGGAEYALLSLIVPGVGDHFVNKGNGTFFGKNISPWVTTIGVLGILGTGALYKFNSQKNYDLYHSSTNQKDINKYYDLANGQNRTSWQLIGVGGMLWVADICWVIAKGMKNTKESSAFHNTNGITFYPSINSSNSLSLNFKITF